MNRKEDAILLRLYCVLDEIPKPAGMYGGTQSASINGFIVYAKDMAAIQGCMKDIVHHTRVDELNDATRYMDALEKWVALRKEQDWKDIFPFPTTRQFLA